VKMAKTEASETEGRIHRLKEKQVMLVTTALTTLWRLRWLREISAKV
jgi:hypothetical protein